MSSALDPRLYSRSEAETYTVELESPETQDVKIISVGQQSGSVEFDWIPDDFLEAMAEYQSGNLLDLDEALEEEDGSQAV
jgi:hypothetical protein